MTTSHNLKDHERHGEHHGHHGEHHGEHYGEHQEENVLDEDEKNPLRDPLSTRGPGSQFPFVLQTKNRGEENEATSINTIVSSGSPDSKGKKCIDKVRITITITLTLCWSSHATCCVDNDDGGDPV